MSSFILVEDIFFLLTTCVELPEDSATFNDSWSSHIIQLFCYVVISWGCVLPLDYRSWTIWGISCILWPIV